MSRKRTDPETHQGPEPMTRDEILEQYQRAFTVINRRLFNDGLPPIMIDYPEGSPEEWPPEVLEKIFDEL